MPATCANCKSVYEPIGCDGKRNACPVCGYSGRIYEENVHEQVEAGDCQRLVHYKGGMSRKKGELSELITGKELSVRLGHLVTKHRLRDRQNDKYEEWVTDPRTGEVIHSDSGTLSGHQGHGSDKLK